MSPTFPNFWQAVVLVLVLFSAQAGAGISAEIIGRVVGIEYLSTNPLVLGMANLVCFGLPVFAFWWKSQVPFRELFPISPLPPVLLFSVVLISVGAMIVLSELDNCFRFFFPMPPFLQKFFEQLSNGENLVASFFCIALVAPVTEELIFRGIVFKGFLHQYSPRKSLLLSAILFAFIHMNPWQMISALLIGIILGWYYFRTRNLLPCLLGHAINNGLVAINSLWPFQISGFNYNDPNVSVQFQPWWFDLIGLFLATLGMWLFHRHAPYTQWGTTSEVK